MKSQKLFACVKRCCKICTRCSRSGSNRDILMIIFHKNICYDPSLELCHRDGSNKGSQYMFSLVNTKNFLRLIFNTFSYLELWCPHTF